MKQNGHIIWMARTLALLLVVGVVALVVYLPLVAAILFVALVAFVAIARGKTEGFWSGVRVFIREILFGW